MKERRNAFDVTNTVNVTDPVAVGIEVCRLYALLYPQSSCDSLKRAFSDFKQLFSGEYPGFMACDTPYHDLQHTLDMTLAMARIISGYERSCPRHDRLGPDLALLGLITALFHDAGYVRKKNDRRHGNGAEYTRIHVSRSARFLAAYLPSVGLTKAVPITRKLVHFTGYEYAVHEINISDSRLRMLGKLLGTADLMAQMSDRCYLEKCRDRLYPEFVAAGMTGPDGPGGGYASPEDFIYKTPLFFQHAIHDRLNGCLKGAHEHFKTFFNPHRHYYLEAVENNQTYLREVVEKRDVSLLRRRPPWTLVTRGFPITLAA